MFLLARKESYCLNVPYLYAVILKDFDGILKFSFFHAYCVSLFALFLLFYNSRKLLQIKGVTSGLLQF